MKLSFVDWIYSVFAYITVAIFSIFCLLPFWLMAAGSITTENELLTVGYRLIPHTFSVEAYKVLFASESIYRSYGVTLIVTSVGTLLALIVTSMLAYSIANRHNEFRKIILFLVYFTMLFQGGIVPLYILISNWLHLANSLWALILPLVVNPFFVFIMVSFFRSVSEEMIESGRIEGANEIVIFFRLVIPVSTPMIATVGLFYALVYWNDWFYGLLFISNDVKFPLQLLLRRLISNITAAQSLIPSGANMGIQVPSYQIRMGTTILTIGPIVFLYPFVQRYFVKGLTLGSIKG